MSSHADQLEPEAEPGRPPEKESHTFMVAFDGGAPAERALAAAGDLARSGDVIALVCVVGDLPSGEPAAGDRAKDPDTLDGVYGEAVERGERVLADAAARLSGRDLFVTKKLLVGEPTREICCCAEEIDADVIVLGTRHRGRLEGMLLGSVSDEIVHCARRPVLVCR